MTAKRSAVTRPAAPMAEAELQKAVTDMCRLFGLKHHHQRISQLSAPGWPDLTICGTGIIFRELKRDGKHPTLPQHYWGEWLREAGGDWDVWRPEDLRSGRIQRELEVLR